MKMSKHSVIYDEIILQGMFYCPFGKEKYSCIFHWLQKKTTADKTAWYRSLTYRDKQDLMYCHFRCLYKKIANLVKIKYYQYN